MVELTCPNCGQPLKLVKADGGSAKNPSIAEIEHALGEHAKLVEISQAGASGAIVVNPRGYLRKDFGAIADKLKPFNARYVSDGKNSRWEI